MSETFLPSTFTATLQDLVNWFEVQQTPYVLIGGVAVSLLAQPRATQDIDVLIWLDAGLWQNFLRAGEAHGFEPRINDVLGFAVRARGLLLRHQKSGINIDISCGALDFEKEMIERAANLNIGELKLKAPTLEDLIITKAVAQRLKDIADIETLLNVHPNLDLAHIRYWTKEFATALEMPELSERLEEILHRYERQDEK